MKTTYLFLILGLVATCGFAQESSKSNNSYNMFSWENCNNKFFVASNSGLKNTPLGIRIGFICKTGAYIGARYGKGEIYNSDSDFNTVDANLFSITTGLIKPIFFKKNFGLNVFGGVGYGEWWPYRWERWTESGYELEGGFMVSFKSLLINLSANMLDGTKTYATWDFTVGIGSRF